MFVIYRIYQYPLKLNNEEKHLQVIGGFMLQNSENICVAFRCQVCCVNVRPKCIGYKDIKMK